MRSRGNDPANGKHSGFREALGLAWALITLLFSINVAGTKLYLVYLYGLSRVWREDLRFLDMPKGRAWTVSNGDLITEGHFVHYLISVVCWVALCLATYPLWRLLMPATRKLQVEGHHNQKRERRLEFSIGLNPLARWFAPFILSRDKRRSKQGDAEEASWKYSIEVTPVAHWVIEREAPPRTAAELTQDERRITEGCRRAGASLSITDNGWVLGVRDDACVANLPPELRCAPLALAVRLDGAASDQTIGRLKILADTMVSITLGACRVTAAGIAQLSEFPRVKALAVDELGRNLSLAEFVDCLESLPQLQVLAFLRPVDDEEIIRRLHGMENLRTVLIGGKLIKGHS